MYSTVRKIARITNDHKNKKMPLTRKNTKIREREDSETWESRRYDMLRCEKEWKRGGQSLDFARCDETRIGAGIGVDLSGTAEEEEGEGDEVDAIC